ncbi:MAG: M23 family metallopeptidase [Verrucomicrobiales bacterium]|jgi:murein DD-endopeptidase MepM/ murein hydrolase activator NlpD|nr:M23 family metallopeptidase [Verrucomicrobiales bacterium]
MGLLHRFRVALVAFGLLVATRGVSSQPFRLPTDNRGLLEGGGEARFFAPTPGRSWEAGQFGCVRSEGWKMHEGIDILATRKDRRGEPLDEARAAADGEVAYISRKAGLSNYGVYCVVRHRIEGLEVLTLYAHLREVRSDLRPGSRVRAGERLGIMGRTTNTRSPITRDRAHLHLEIDLLVNDRFSSWLHAREPKTRDDHGAWNGRNLLGLDPAEIYRAQQRQGDKFSLLTHIRTQNEMCKVLVADTKFPWIRRYPMLIRRNPVAEREGIVAYEASLNYNGLPFSLTPRARSEISGSVSTRLLSVNAEEYRRHPCRKLVFQKGQTWVLTAAGNELLSLLSY